MQGNMQCGKTFFEKLNHISRALKIEFGKFVNVSIAFDSGETSSDCWFGQTPKNDARNSTCAYKYLTRKGGQLQKRLAKSTNSVIVNYRCKLNQDFTNSHLSRHRLSDYCPMVDIPWRPRCMLCENTCVMTKTLAPECKWIYVLAKRQCWKARVTTNGTTAGQNDARTSGGNKCVLFSVNAKVYSTMICFNCQNTYMRKKNSTWNQRKVRIPSRVYLTFSATDTRERIDFI